MNSQAQNNEKTLIANKGMNEMAEPPRREPHYNFNCEQEKALKKCLSFQNSLKEMIKVVDPEAAHLQIGLKFTWRWLKQKIDEYMQLKLQQKSIAQNSEVIKIVNLLKENFNIRDNQELIGVLYNLSPTSTYTCQ